MDVESCICANVAWQQLPGKWKGRLDWKSEITVVCDYRHFHVHFSQLAVFDSSKFENTGRF